METIGNHLLQMACWLTCFWLIYFVFLRKETFYETNRWFLLFGLLCSLILPFFPVTYTVMRAPLNTDLLLNATVVTTVTQPEPSFFRENLWLWIYLSGILLFAIRFIAQGMNVRKFEKNGIRLEVESTEVILIEKETAPFSFFRKIFISQSLQNELEIKTIVSHEKVHIEERHWIDLLIFEVVRALQWFNPLLFFYRKAMMQNHEYLADRGATANGMNIRTYQAILANQLLGVPVVKYASSFTMFNPTKRILMMNKNRTRPMKRLKLLLAIPLAAFILYAFAEPKYVSENKSINSEKTNCIEGQILDQYGKSIPNASVLSANNQVLAISNNEGKFEIDNMNSIDDITISKEGYYNVSKIKGDNGNVAFLMMGHPSSTNSSETKPITVNGKITDQNGNPLPGTHIIVAHSTIGTTSDIDGKFSLSGLKKGDELVFSFVGYKTVKMKAGENLKIKMEREVVKVSTNQNTGEMAPPPPPPPISEPVYSPTFSINKQSLDIEKDALIVVDGKISNVNLEQIEASSIESINVIKGTPATDKYGYKAKDGAVEITTKKEAYQKQTNQNRSYTTCPSPEIRIRDTPPAGKEPLVVVDGNVKEYGYMKTIDPETIQSINVLKNDMATDKYGDKGKNGVIEFTTKKLQSGNTYNVKVDKDQVVDENGVSVSGYANEKKDTPEEIKVTGYANQQKKEDNQFVAVEEIPEFPGGASELGAYLNDKTSKTKKEGKVEVYFIVDKDGSIGNIKIVESASPELDQLATKIIKEMPKWTPGKQNGKSVKVEMQIGIMFGNNCYSTKHRFKE